MSRILLVVDSETGALIDVLGNKRENGRYAKFARRMLSLDKNPILNYGANGGKSLEISCNGAAGAGTVINLVADKVKVSGAIVDSDGRTMSQIAEGRMGSVLARIVGKKGEIKVVPGTNDGGETTAVISLDDTIGTKLSQIEEDYDAIKDLPDSMVTADDIAEAVSDIHIQDGDDLAAVRSALAALLDKLSNLSTTEQGEGHD